MSGKISHQEQLLNKANSLPLGAGVYIMRDQKGRVIYVGKSRKLKNRVSQYFQNSQKAPKTARMVSQIADFDYILCQTEIEALTLENTLIKQYAPKYNIRLKDAKSYPYIKITDASYPRIIETRARVSDHGKYFGPFSGMAAVRSILDILYKTLGIPGCKRSFPKDIGKERPCIYYQMKQCCGVCTGAVSEEEYGGLIRCATDILRGHTAQAIQSLEEKMSHYAEAEQYEAAARCRDTIRALRKLTEKQSVVADPDTNMDVFGLYLDESFTCLSIMQVRDGAVVDKADFSLSADAITDSDTLSAFLVDYYIRQDYIPKNIVLSFDLEEGDQAAVEQLLSEKAKTKVSLKHPQRGATKDLCKTVVHNAQEKARQTRLQAQKDESVLLSLARLLHLETVPERIEAYDISNIGSENLTAGMVVFHHGKPEKSDYRTFRIQSVEGTDDYASMQEAIRRRIKHLKEDASGSFAAYPDLILVDGGRGHVSVAEAVLREEGVDIPVFGMVKDEYHKTRALCTVHEEINIGREQSVFMLIYRIQEEVHRFTVGRTTQAKRKTLKHSSLEKIDGIGPKKAKLLLGALGTLSAVQNASVDEISAIRGISASDAVQIYEYFHKNQKGETIL